MNNQFEQKYQFERNINKQFEQNYQQLNEKTNNKNQFEQKCEQSIWKKISTINLNKTIYKYFKNTHIKNQLGKKNQ